LPCPWVIDSADIERADVGVDSFTDSILSRVRDKEDHKEDNRERDGAHDNLGDGSFEYRQKDREKLVNTIAV